MVLFTKQTILIYVQVSHFPLILFLSQEHWHGHPGCCIGSTPVSSNVWQLRGAGPFLPIPFSEFMSYICNLDSFISLHSKLELFQNPIGF